MQILIRDPYQRSRFCLAVGIYARRSRSTYHASRNAEHDCLFLYRICISLLFCFSLFLFLSLFSSLSFSWSSRKKDSSYLMKTERCARANRRHDESCNLQFVSVRFRVSCRKINKRREKWETQKRARKLVSYANIRNIARRNVRWLFREKTNRISSTCRKRYYSERYFREKINY